MWQTRPLCLSEILNALFLDLGALQHRCDQGHVPRAGTAKVELRSSILQKPISFPEVVGAFRDIFDVES